MAGATDALVGTVITQLGWAAVRAQGGTLIGALTATFTVLLPKAELGVIVAVYVVELPWVIVRLDGETARA